MNFQRVVPIKANARWNVITRTMVPLIWQPGFLPAEGSRFSIDNKNRGLELTAALLELKTGDPWIDGERVSSLWWPFRSGRGGTYGNIVHPESAAN